MKEVAVDLSGYSIGYKGLRVGKHSFEFDIDDDFFARFPGSELSSGKLKARVELNRQNNLLEFDIEIAGTVKVECDRCLELFDLPVRYSGVLIGRIGGAEQEGTDEIIFLSDDDYEVNLAQYFYESISLSLPLQRYHGVNGTDSGQCDADMLKRIEHIDTDADRIDPRWESLRKLKDN